MAHTVEMSDISLVFSVARPEKQKLGQIIKTDTIPYGRKYTGLVLAFDYQHPSSTGTEHSALVIEMVLKQTFKSDCRIRSTALCGHIDP